MLKDKWIYLIAITAFLLACSEDNTSKPILDVPFSEAATSSSSFVETQSFATDISSSSLEIISSAENVSSSSDTSLFASSSSEMSSATESSSSEWGPVSYGELIDERDGQVYRTVKIGEQIWMAENLNYAYIQADEKRDSSYKCDNRNSSYCEMRLYELDSLSYCYNNNPDNCKKYGRLYMWDAALDCGSAKQKKYRICHGYRSSTVTFPGICPEKWHIPSFMEWNVLSSFVKYSAKYLKSKTEWLDGKNGIDVLGFSVIPAGIYPNDPYINEDFDIINEAFIGIYEDLIGQHACFWSAEQSGNAMSFDADYYQFFSDAYAFCFANEDEHIYSDLAPKTLGLSVRCVKDSLADE